MSKAKLIHEADVRFSRRIRAYGRCQRCGSTWNLECAHIRRRGFHSTRWDIDNALCLCHDCHVDFTEHPPKFEAWVKWRFGERRWDDLVTRSRQEWDGDIEAVLARLR